MAFPLKSGADLYNQQLIRAAIWNHGADPSETVTGLFYFNTSNSSAGKKLRLYTGSAWKTIAFEEDLDVANNAEFKALEDKVKLLAGDIDTDAIISNMKEVSNFLAGFAEDANLMSMLDDKLSKTNGGTISGALTINAKDSTSVPLRIETTKSSYVAMIMRTNAGHNGHLIYAGNADWAVSDAGWKNSYTLLHSGNVGEYNAGSADVIATTYTNQSINYRAESRVRLISLTASNSIDLGAPKQYISGLSVMSDYVGWQLVSGASQWENTDFYIRKIADSGEYLAWKQIAFTDSTVSAANRLVTPNGVPYCYSYEESAATIFGANSYDSYIDGTSITFRNSSYNPVLLINSSGNVTIGASDLAGTRAKLYVDGSVYVGNNKVLERVSNNLYIGSGIRGSYDTSIFGTNILFNTLSGDNAMIIAIGGNVGIGTTAPQYKLDVNGVIAISGISQADTPALLFNNGSGEYFDNRGNMILSANSGSWNIFDQNHFNVLLRVQRTGNVGIGLTNPLAKLHVSEDIVANGTIACKGIAAEGSEVGMGTVDKKVLYISSSTTQQTFSLTHGLNTREITVCVFEITSTGTNMILTDVEITGDNTISVSFGNPPTDNHMVVVMG